MLRIVRLDVFVHVDIDEDSDETLEATGLRIQEEVTEVLRDGEFSAGIDIVGTEDE
jgi:hypothetical protein